MESLLKEEFKELMNLEGQVRGIAFRSGTKFFLKKIGKEGLAKVEKTITELGYPIKFQNVEPMHFYPIGLMAVSLVLVKRLFNFTDKDFQDMGAAAAKSPLILRLYVRHFVSLDWVARQVQKLHAEYFSVGKTKVTELNKEKRYMVIRRENFRLHPLHCQITKGFFPAVVQMVVGGKVTCEQTKSIFQGDPYHEYILRW